MIIDFSNKLQSIQDDKQRKGIVCKCALDSFIAVTQEINSILMILKNEGVAPIEFVEYVETSSGRIAPRMLQRLAKVHGGNLLEVSKKLEKDLAKQPRLTGEEISALRKQEKEIGADYFMENEPIIVKKLNDYLIELLEMDSI